MTLRTAWSTDLTEEILETCRGNSHLETTKWLDCSSIKRKALRMNQQMADLLVLPRDASSWPESVFGSTRLVKESTWAELVYKKLAQDINNGMSGKNVVKLILIFIRLAEACHQRGSSYCPQ